jgi:transposase InsO family protein
LWVSDITQHRTGEGWVYCAVVLDAYSRRIVGWSIADHLRTELVVDALEMACLRRRPPVGRDTSPATVFHSDHGSQGGFNWSSQHLDRGGVDGQASRVDAGADGSLADEVSGEAIASPGCGAVVLA